MEKVRNGKAGGRSRILSCVLLGLAAVVSLALTAGFASAKPGSGNHGNGNNGNPCPGASHDPGGEPPCGFAPPEQPTPAPEPQSTDTPSTPPHPSGGVLASKAKGHKPAPKAHSSPGTVTVPAHPNPVVHHIKKHHKAPPHPPGPGA
ncbi:MAG: hypothetical protein ACJ75Z_02015, partial [Solirubrobacterales bacterium]